jgi:hypothetical protein
VHVQTGAGRILSSQDLDAPSERAFRLLCDVEHWPEWLSFVRGARIEGDGPLAIGAEIAIESSIPGGDGAFEVEHFIAGHVLSLVGAYSVRRRLDFRIEGLGLRCRLVVRLDYPAYGGVLGGLFDQVTARPRLTRALAASLIHIKNQVEGEGGGLGLDDL